EARLGRILRAAPQVMSLRKVHDSNSDSFVSHPNATAQQRRPQQTVELRQTAIATAVCCSGCFGPVEPQSDSCALLSRAAPLRRTRRTATTKGRVNQRMPHNPAITEATR